MTRCDYSGGHVRALGPAVKGMRRSPNPLRLRCITRDDLLCDGLEYKYIC
ncbi:hypothetical protein IQ273_00320 [Nodosilinea sp. LEGE 07298]|nr:hypothetical protein [Nodosilinea sp. LEGE 07298]MBE9107870.1 hypothetical protein [Nodosilinea sp. LEGE 07298]